MSICRAFTVLPTRAMATKAPKPPSSAVTGTKKTQDEVDVSQENIGDGSSASISGQTKINYNKDGVGFKAEKYTDKTFFNPLLTPPPRSPRSPEDFMNPTKLGHWKPLGFDYVDPVKDIYSFHELMFAFFTGGFLFLWIYHHAPDYKHRDWARREAFLRTTKREALGLPLIDPNVVDPDRIVLPTEEELAAFNWPVTQ